MPTAENLFPQLEAACDGLLWRSETDAPFDPVYWETRGNELHDHDLLYRSGHAVDAPVQIVSLETFFEQATVDRAWHDSVEKQRVQRYRNLKDLLETALENLKVYRIGEGEVKVYILGDTEDSKVMGVKTTLIET